MKANAILFCLCAVIFTQCDRIGNEVYIPEPGSGEPVESVTQPPEEEIPAEEAPQTPEEPVYVSAYEQIDTSFDEIYKKAACLSPAKTGEVNDIVGKWQLALEINGKDTTDRSCEAIVYHFREDGTLTVSNTEDVCDYEYDAYPFCPSCLPKCKSDLNFRKGNDAAVFCEVLLRKMFVYPQTSYTELGCSYPDHEIRTLFLRIE
ncbi:MAG: hypothetical protein LBP50_06820 [Tannerella sp.]|jgi:hypothetical protein|nr:hypothetical protein [Tannerella sp.]